MSTTGKAEQPTWPTFKAAKPDPILGRKEMSPEQTLVEFISTSASYHGVKSQSLRSLEWDLLKVFPNNIMPANAAAWYMAKRKFYSNQPLDLQLLAYLIKKYPDKFRISKYKVEFLETYSKEVARRKMIYLVQYGLFAYFSHKVEEHGVYFFDPQYYEQTEPFHESLRTCVRESKARPVPAYFAQLKDQFDFKIHSVNLVSIAKQPGAKVITNTTGVIVSMVNNQYGNIKFGAGETAIFCAKALFRDGWQYTGDPLRLPAMQFDAYKLVSGGESDVGGGGDKDNDDPWIAVLVWCGRKPASKYYSMVADFNYTPLFQSNKKRQHQAEPAVEGRKLRQPSSSMMIGQVISIKKNGAVISVRDDSEDRVFVPGWCRELNNRPGVWLTTLTGDCIGLRDLVAYYIDVDETVPGYTAVGKNVMVLKEYEETDPTKKRRSRRSVSMSAGAEYDHSEEEFAVKEIGSSDTSDTGLSDSELEVSDGELEWLQQDLTDLIAREGSGGKNPTLFTPVMTALNQALASKSQTKKKGRKSSGRDSGLESRETTPKAARPPYTPRTDEKTFWRTKAALAAVDSYRSSDDEDFKSGDEIPSEEEENRPSRRRRSKVETSQTSGTSTASITSSATLVKSGRRADKSAAAGEKGGKTAQGGGSGRPLPYWVRAISLPEEFEPETGRFLPVDRWYKEERDRDYELPLTEEEYEEYVEWEDEETAQEGAVSADQAAVDGQKDATEADHKDDKSVPEEGSVDKEAAATTKDGSRRRRGSRRSSVVVTEIAAEEVELLLKEAEEPLPEDLLRGAHRTRPAPESESTEAKQDAEKSEEGEDAGAESGSAKPKEQQQEGVVVVEGRLSDFARWAIKALNPLPDKRPAEGSTEEEETDDDEEYVPPSVIFDADLDYGEFEPEDEDLEEGELEGLLADQKLDVQRLLMEMPGTNYLPIWVPIESVRQRKEAAEALCKEKEAAEAARKEKEAAKAALKDKEASKEPEAADQQKLLTASATAQETGLTPAMKKLAVTAKADKDGASKSDEDEKKAKAGKKVTRAKVGSTSTSPKEGDKKSPTKKGVAVDKGGDAAAPKADDTATTDAKEDGSPSKKAAAKQRRASGDNEGKSPKKATTPRRKKSDAGKKSPEKGVAVEAGGDAAAAAAVEKKKEEGGEQEVEKPQQCMQN